MIARDQSGWRRRSSSKQTNLEYKICAQKGSNSNTHVFVLEMGYYGNIRRVENWFYRQFSVISILAVLYGGTKVCKRIHATFLCSTWNFRAWILREYAVTNTLHHSAIVSSTKIYYSLFQPYKYGMVFAIKFTSYPHNYMSWYTPRLVVVGSKRSWRLSVVAQL